MVSVVVEGNMVAVVEEEKHCKEAKKGGRKMDNCFFGGRKGYNHSQKCWEGCPFYLFFSFLPSPAPGPMLIKTLMFVRVIVLLYPNIE